MPFKIRLIPKSFNHGSALVFPSAPVYFHFMDSTDITNPHDKFFREALSHKDMALGFIEEYVPIEVRKQLDLKSLEIVKDSYIDKELSEHFSDILYMINMAGKPSFLYLLFEHKSYSDQLVQFQLLRNMVFAYA